MTREVSERIAVGMIAAWRDRATRIDGGEAAELDGVVVAISNLPTDDQSVALVARPPADPLGALRWAEERFRARGRALGIEIELGRHPEVEAAIRELGLRLAIARPAMAVAIDRVAGPVPAAGVEIRRAEEHEDLLALVDLEVEVFGTDPAVARGLVGPAWLPRHDARRYLALEGGRPVAGASTHLDGRTLGLFGIGTLEHARRRGIGTAVTAFAIHDHRDVADLAWLEPSPMGRPVYERMGFTAVSDWEIWVRRRGERGSTSGSA